MGQVSSIRTEALTLLSPGHFEALGLIKTPLYAFSFDINRICWANAAARDFWGFSPSVEISSINVGPLTAAHKVKVEHMKGRLLRGEAVIEEWNHSLSRRSERTQASFTGVEIENFGKGMLVELLPVAAASPLPDAQRRSLEMSDSTPAMLSMFSEGGQLLARNAASLSCFGASDFALGPGTDAFREQFLLQSDYDSFIEAMNENGSYAVCAAMNLPGKPVHGLDVRKIVDPVSGEPAILVSQADVSTVDNLIGLRSSGAKDEMDNLIALTAVPLIVLSPSDASIKRANTAAQKRFGYRVQPGSPAPQIFSDPMQGKSLINAIRASGSGQVACYLRDAEDVSFWTTVTGTWASGPTGESIVLMVSDIDDLHQRSLLLEEALDFERRTNELQRRYLAFAAHDFRTPLAIIDSSAQKILRKVQDKPLASVAQAASKIRDTVQRLLNLTDATIGKARKGIGLSGLDFGRGDLAALLRSVVDFQKDLHRDVSIDLRIEDLGLVSFDALLIEQALSNVLSNSIKYSGSVKKVEITAEKRGTNIILCFRDWGIGIPVDQLETIFTAHSRGENVGMIPGTGLGLSIARQIFEMHQGTLRVAETSPAGSTFEIIIPTRAQPSQAND